MSIIQQMRLRRNSERNLGETIASVPLLSPTGSECGVVPFYKFECLGRDFLLLDNRNGKLSERIKDEVLLAKMCRRLKGIGSEGIIEIRNHHNAAFELRCYGLEGQSIPFTLSAGCCAISFAKQCKLLVYNEIYFQAHGFRWYAIFDEINDQVHIRIPDEIMGKITKLDQGNYLTDDPRMPYQVRYINHITSDQGIKEAAETALQENDCENLCFVYTDEDHSTHMRVFGCYGGSAVVSCGDAAVAVVMAEVYRREVEGVGAPCTGEEYVDCGVYHQDVSFDCGSATVHYEKSPKDPTRLINTMFFAQTNFVFQGMFPVSLQV